jgi:polyisoprenoid-binding protein YceI
MFAFVLGVLLAIDPAHSKAEFSVEHLFVEHVTGVVPIVHGTVDLPDGATVPKHVSAVLDPTKMRTGEDDRDGALQTADWFDTKQFPTWSFDSEKITPTAAGFIMSGLLTIHGVSKEEALTVLTLGTPEHPIYHATCTIDRHVFGMKTTRLDPAIGTMVDVTLDIFAH